MIDLSILFRVAAKTIEDFPSASIVIPKDRGKNLTGNEYKNKI